MIKLEIDIKSLGRAILEKLKRMDFEYEYKRSAGLPTLVLKFELSSHEIMEPLAK